MIRRYPNLNNALRNALKRSPSGEVATWQIVARTLLAAECDDDYMAAPMLPVLKHYLPAFHGASVADLGCYGGWLLGWLRRHKVQCDYVGIDEWFEAIVAAQIMYEVQAFACMDLRDWTGRADVVWCTQLMFTTTEEADSIAAIVRDRSNKLGVMTAPRIHLLSASMGHVIEKIGDAECAVWRH